MSALRKACKILAIALPLGMIVLGVLGYLGFRRVMQPHPPTYETAAPELPDGFGRDGRPAIVVLSKTNGFRHVDAIPAAHEALAAIAERRGWALLATESGAAMSAPVLERTRAVVWNNVSGDVLTPEQRAEFRAWIEAGGGFVGIHGSGGDFEVAWDWYAETLIGARFIGHILTPQFQDATLRIEDRTHPATRSLPLELVHNEEWYSFDASPRRRGVRVLASVDESSYSPEAFWGLRDLRMGDHPVIWCHCVERGRSLYSALGHQAAAYALPEYAAILEGAIAWAAGLEGAPCGHPIAAP